MSHAKVLQTNQGNYQLCVDGAPFFIKGAGLEFGQMSTLAECGGNTFRTWRVDNGVRSAEDILDEAHSLGLKVCMGLELERERHGFDYSDARAVAQQQAAIMADVIRLKDHPALLMWGLGNELNLRASNPRVWDAVESLCQAIKAVDSDHLVTTMLAGIDSPTLNHIAKRAPSLDLLSFQIYGEIDQLPSILKKVNYTGPYQITEWGPTGHWESPETTWRRPIEPPSFVKAADIARRYHQIILADKARCLGAYIFLWGQKQERTPTWYGMFLENGQRTESVDVMEHAWTGKWPRQRAPRIERLTLNARSAEDSVTGMVGDTFTAEATLSGVDEHCFLSWYVRAEVDRVHESDGGDFEPTPACLLSLCNTRDRHFQFDLIQPGEYRLYCEVDNNAGGSGVANIPFLVTESKIMTTAKNKKVKNV